MSRALHMHAPIRNFLPHGQTCRMVPLKTQIKKCKICRVYVRTFTMSLKLVWMTHLAGKSFTSAWAWICKRHHIFRFLWRALIRVGAFAHNYFCHLSRLIFAFWAYSCSPSPGGHKNAVSERKSWTFIEKCAHPIYVVPFREEHLVVRLLSFPPRPFCCQNGLICVKIYAKQVTFIPWLTA